MKRKIIWLAMVAAVVMVGTVLGQVGAANANDDGNSMVVDLLAGQVIKVGTITVTSDADNLYVTYETNDGWCLTETHLHIGENENDFPFAGMTRNPVPGLLDYSEDHNPCVTSYTYTIPLSALGDEVTIAAHAAVTKDGVDETAWADGTRFTARGNWAMYFTYTTNDGGQPPPVVE